MRARLLAAALLVLASPGGGAAPPSRRAVSSSAVAISPDGALVAAVNPDSDSITIVKAGSLQVVAEVRVGREPRALCFSADSRTIAVANRGSADVSVLVAPGFKAARQVRTGAMPHGVLIDGERLLVSEFEAGTVAVIDLASGHVSTRIATGAFPSGLALSADRESLYVTHFFSGRLVRVDLKTLAVGGAVETGARSNLSQFVAISPDGRRGYLPQSLSGADAVPRNFDTTIIPIVNVVDLPLMTLLPRERLLLSSLQHGANRPLASAVSPDGRHLYTANAGSDDVVITEIATGRALARVAVGSNPQGLALSADGKRLYVDNALDGTLSVIRADSGAGTTFRVHPRMAVRRGMKRPDALKNVDFDRPISCASCHTGGADSRPLGSDVLVELFVGRLRMPRGAWTAAATVPLTKIPLPPALLEGKKLFNSAVKPELSAHSWISCASCHPDGGMDGRTWLDFPDGPRNTPALFGAGETHPLHWSGNLDELQDVEITIRSIQFGRGLAAGAAHEPLGAPYAGSSAELDALAAYVASLKAPVPAAADKDALERGAEAFKTLGCLGCHAPPAYTDHKTHGVGTGDPAKERSVQGTRFDTPSLRGLRLTAPYFHDGSAPTLEEALRTGREHDVSGRVGAEERRALIDYLLSL